jgi:ketosteroid isomerase-like protein
VSQADVDMIRAGYEAFNRGDVDFIVRQAAPDFELVTAERVPNPGTYRGADEARRFFEDLFEPFEEIVIEPQEFFDRGDRVLALVTVRSRPRGSSAVVENRIAHLWTVRDGKAIRFQIFPERARGLEALGLSELDIRG